MIDDRFIAVWGSYGFTALAMIGALIAARLVLSRVKRELDALRDRKDQS
jgi:hypothetical protein